LRNAGGSYVTAYTAQFWGMLVPRHGAGTSPLRAQTAVRGDTYDQLKTVNNGDPLPFRDYWCQGYVTGVLAQMGPGKFVKCPDKYADLTMATTQRAGQQQKAESAPAHALRKLETNTLQQPAWKHLYKGLDVYKEYLKRPLHPIQFVSIC
jgi:hypothetical protein